MNSPTQFSISNMRLSFYVSLAISKTTIVSVVDEKFNWVSAVIDSSIPSFQMNSFELKPWKFLILVFHIVGDTIIRMIRFFIKWWLLAIFLDVENLWIRFFFKTINFLNPKTQKQSVPTNQTTFYKKKLCHLFNVSGPKSKTITKFSVLIYWKLVWYVLMWSILHIFPENFTSRSDIEFLNVSYYDFERSSGISKFLKVDSVLSFLPV